MNDKIKIALFLVLAYIAVPLALGSNAYVIGLIVAALTIGGIAVAWALLGNLGGMVSFGHAAFFGVGAYVSALLTLKGGWPVFPSMLMAGIGAAIASVATMPALRLRGPYFALAILAYAEIFRILATEAKPITGGAAGLLSIPRLPIVLGLDFGSKLGGYFVILTIVAASMAVYHLIRSSTYGLALKAMHDSEDATRVVGVNSTLLKAWMLAVSAFITGVVGAFNAHYINFLEPDYAFAGQWTTLAIVSAIFGGYRTVTGPLLGALVVYLVDQLAFKPILPQGHQIVLGVLLGAMILFSPGGLMPLLLAKKKGPAHAA
ncbi:Branched-chain amino acid transport system permease protein LivM [Paramagnetospirillum magnetotacticum MS-1]|uniref:Branched-chain amino acid transport system permease protein LivM n=1 Tax=Paramagnetospirillum magnetotacticum MS-1 TaxID=272627 RepID=A0A0C2YWG3_PARME|nr:branched-chain amino acid ABC transporter permease [Paramagnetospirillum magnetotacticum]KIL99040.1 Branched-chain amino acid transport system permease protein LivM [Paramagnetospirillum magnetotacticum MS-1]